MAQSHRERTALVAVVLVLGGLAVYLASRSWTTPIVSGAISFPVFPVEKTAFSPMVNTTVNVPSFALSPDGRTLVFSAGAQGAKPTLWLRTVDRVDARQLGGTEDAQDPFWSPDGDWIAFIAAGK